MAPVTRVCRRARGGAATRPQSSWWPSLTTRSGAASRAGQLPRTFAHAPAVHRSKSHCGRATSRRLAPPPPPPNTAERGGGRRSPPRRRHRSRHRLQIRAVTRSWRGNSRISGPPRATQAASASLEGAGQSRVALAPPRVAAAQEEGQYPSLRSPLTRPSANARPASSDREACQGTGARRRRPGTARPQGGDPARNAAPWPQRGGGSRRARRAVRRYARARRHLRQHHASGNRERPTTIRTPSPP